MSFCLTNSFDPIQYVDSPHLRNMNRAIYFIWISFLSTKKNRIIQNHLHVYLIIHRSYLVTCYYPECRINRNVINLFDACNQDRIICCVEKNSFRPLTIEGLNFLFAEKCRMFDWLFNWKTIIIIIVPYYYYIAYNISKCCFHTNKNSNNEKWTIFGTERIYFRFVGLLRYRMHNVNALEVSLGFTISCKFNDSQYATYSYFEMVLNALHTRTNQFAMPQEPWEF